MSENEVGRTKFRKYAATAVAAGAITAVLVTFVTGGVESIAEGGLFGMILGMAAKYLWEENAS